MKIGYTGANKILRCICEILNNCVQKVDELMEKLNGIDESANKTVVDIALSSASANPVQNKSISAKFATQLSSEDLNTIKPDFATFYYAAGGNSCTNNPGGTGKAFGIIAYKSASGYTTQEIVTQGGQKMYRYYNNSVWSDWKTVVDSSNYKTYCTPANIGAASANHPLLYDSGWIIATSSGTDVESVNIKYRKIGKVVEIRGYFSAKADSNSIVVLQLPSEYHPTAVVCRPSVKANGDISRINVSTSGTVTADGRMFEAGKSYRCDALFLVD